VPQSNKKADPLASRRPDYQELLVDVRLWLWLRHEEKEQGKSLLDLVRTALTPSERHHISRFGGLALGESTNLINHVDLNPKRPSTDELSFLVNDEAGYYSLPVWVDHPRTGQERAMRKRFAIRKMAFETPPGQDPRWIKIAP
jgi:CRISPR-associated protein Cas5/DevS